MSEKRPRILNRLSKDDPAYWSSRLYKNVFTYNGRRVPVPSWSVKIQLFGQRRAFTLNSKTRAQAGEEACRIFKTVVERGWQGLDEIRKPTTQPARDRLGPDQAASISNDLEYWKLRLIQRKYPEPLPHEKTREFSVRIAHGRTAHYFALGTTDETEAATQAMRIYQTVVDKGWECANESFPRELALAVRWQDDPLAWTYTTFHTRLTPTPPKPINHLSECHVVFIEPDAGIRFALAACVNAQEGFRCDASFASAAEALREIPRREVQLALANHDLPDEGAVNCFEELQRTRPGLVVLSYSVFPDADELFRSTPGGSVVYLLKRTPATRLFDPIAQLNEPLTHESISSHVRSYFQRLSALLPSGQPFWKQAKLTPREQEILALLSKGDLVKEIASKLGISNWTVQGHVKSIFEKLHVHSRTEAVVKYLQR